MGRNQTKRKSRQDAPKIKALFFDAGNTLMRPHPSVGHIYAEAAGRHGKKVEVAWVEDRFRKAWQSRHDLVMPTKDHEEKDFWREMVRRVFGGLFPPRSFARFFEYLFPLFAHPDRWRLYGDTLPVLRAAKARGLVTGIISNWDSRLLPLSEKLGLTREVDFILVSAVEGVAKPHPGIFKKALRKAGVKAHEAVHIGDSLREDYQGARQAGLAAFLIDRHSPGPKGVPTVDSLSVFLEKIISSEETPHVRRPRRGGSRAKKS